MSADLPGSEVDLTPAPVEQPGLLAQLWRTVGMREWHDDRINYRAKEGDS